MWSLYFLVFSYHHPREQTSTPSPRLRPAATGYEFTPWVAAPEGRHGFSEDEYAGHTDFSWSFDVHAKAGHKNKLHWTKRSPSYFLFFPPSFWTYQSSESHCCAIISIIRSKANKPSSGIFFNLSCIDIRVFSLSISVSQSKRTESCTPNASAIWFKFVILMFTFPLSKLPLNIHL